MSHTTPLIFLTTGVTINSDRFTAPVRAALDRMLNKNDRVLQEHRVASFAVTLVMEAFFGNVVESDRFAHALATHLRDPLENMLRSVLEKTFGTLNAPARLRLRASTPTLWQPFSPSPWSIP